MGIRVLLIEDDETIAEPLTEALGHFGLTVDHVATGTDGLRGPYGDVVLLDLGLPDMDGIDVCRGIRQVSDVPILILSARGEETDRVLGLELGADDYLAKPFSVRELVARIRAVTRRSRRTQGVPEPTAGTMPGALPVSASSALPSPEPSASMAWDAEPASPPPSSPPFPSPSSPFPSPSSPSPSYETQPFPSYEPQTIEPQTIPSYAAEEEASPVAEPGPLVVDRRTRQVWVGGTQVPLTPKEFDLLALLTEDPGAVRSRQEILDRVWDPHYEGPTKTLDVHVAALRRKLGHPAWIQTLRGVGFRLAVHTGPGVRTGPDMRTGPGARP
ncbi:two-component system response regulator [Streptomyces lincolnensis]|uniref:Sensory transduction protein RegX3 n=1 Tax=Streptomyces lincolnensis TaxID=1915 RepID=A0A1B1M8Z6_STRLN|nr:response regulator transcription factor [Streptomyces lincolnensis]ANS65101.1 two-component system response regulator [Streptomyces lincolnensis]AXG56691.1 two-component system response regulator [Streptomyces lincolnensis]QMV06886.1 response regulator [Streptomyces lincolnensis]